MKINNNIKILVLIIVLALLIACNNNDVNEEGNENEQPNGDAIDPSLNEPVPVTVCYTANESGSISVIDIKTNKVVNTIKTDDPANDVKVSPDGKILAVTVSVLVDGNNGDGTNKNGKVLFYDTANNELINQAEVGKHPVHVDFSRNGKYAAVANNKDNTVSIIDMSNYKVTNTVETGEGPNGLRISGDSTVVFVANMGEDSMSIVSLVNFSQINKKQIGKNPVTTAIAGNEQTIFVTLKGEDALAIYDMKNGSIDKINVGKGPSQVFIQSDDKYAFVANEGTEASPSNTVSKVNIETKAVEATIEAGNGAHGIAVSNDNKYIYVTNKYDATVSVIDNATNEVIATIPVDNKPNGITLK